MTLHEIGLKYGTDKSTNHNFTPSYDFHLSHLKDQNINLLEIGISEGPSLKMWEEYFQNGLIIGVDILERSYMNTSRINTIIIDQEKPDELLSIPGEFDIIIDDGGHGIEQQQVTLEEMLPRLKSRGIYILEDLHTSYEYGYSGNATDNTTLNLIECIKAQSVIDRGFYINNLDAIANQIDECNIFYNDTSSDARHRGKSVTSILIKK